MSIDPAALKIIRFPDPRLRARASTVDPADRALPGIIDRLFDLMRDAQGIGLAAPQVGLPMRIFVTHVPDEDPVDRVFINPQLTLDPGGVDAEEEGCLSLPEIRVTVRRALRVRMHALDRSGQLFEREQDGFLARVWQHEYDHLEGKLIIDRMSVMDRLATRRALQDLEADYEAV